MCVEDCGEVSFTPHSSPALNNRRLLALPVPVRPDGLSIEHQYLSNIAQHNSTFVFVFHA